ERCEQFYTVVLGLRIMQRHREPDGSLRSVWFDLGGVILMVELCEGITTAGENGTSASPTDTGWHLLALTITPESRDEWREKLRHAGVQVTGETSFTIYFRDPENNRLALSHYPDRAPGAYGGR
ncbi:MAG: VOC family protein, partial [Desulfobulbaceae bacterium]